MLRKLLLALFIFASTNAFAANLKPFILAQTGTGNFNATVSGVQDALKKEGFEIVGSYEPKPGTKVISITNNYLKEIAQQSEYGGFGLVQRVAVHSSGDTTEVSYSNPTYQWNAYRMNGSIEPVAVAMKRALGEVKSFGAEEGMSADDLRDYHYAFAMPYFSDVDELESYGSYQEAVDTIESGLAAKKEGVFKVYRIDVPGKQVSLFGVGLTQGDGADENILNQIDGKEHSHAAHFCYEILVDGKEAVSLAGKFRIAINWPSLSMMGDRSFMTISGAPSSINYALEEVARK